MKDLVIKAKVLEKTWCLYQAALYAFMDNEDYYQIRRMSEDDMQEAERFLRLKNIHSYDVKRYIYHLINNLKHADLLVVTRSYSEDYGFDYFLREAE